MATATQAAKQAKEVARRLGRAIPEPRCELAHADAWQLLIATILSAQTTDQRVNQTTPALFARFPTAEALGNASQEDVEALVHSTGFFRSKAKSIREASRMLAERHGGKVPRELDALVALPGVARKTANVVLGTAYGIASGMVVDTHVSRVAQRLGLTKETEPVRIEQDLTKLFASRQWVDMGHRILLHGRYVCLAKRPLCARCPLAEICPSREEEPEGSWTKRADQECVTVDSSVTSHLAAGDSAPAAKKSATAGAPKAARKPQRARSRMLT